MMDYAVIVGLFAASTAISWRVTFVLTRSIEKSLDEFKTQTNERLDRQDKRMVKQGESLEQHGALLLQLAREVSLLTGALMGMPNAKGEKERVGSRG